MKICLITSFPPSRGDLNEYGYHLACAIRKADPEVELAILADCVSVAEQYSSFAIIRCWRFNSLLNAVLLLKFIRRIAPDVVWFNMGFATFARSPVAAFLASFIPALCRASGYYTHVTLHSLFEATDLREAGIRHPALYRAAGGIATRVLLRASDVTVLLPSYRALLLHRYGADPERVHCRAHGMFGSTRSGAASGSAERRLILAFGYWGTYKRLELLLEAMEDVSARLEDAALIVAGTNHASSPQYLELLRRRVPKSVQVRFLGYVPEAELPALFGSARVLVMPYTSAAGASGVMHQACEYGLPIVAADIPEIRELAQQLGAAIALYPAGDKAALTDRLVELLERDDLGDFIGNDNEAAAEPISLAETVRGYLMQFRQRIRIVKQGTFVRKVA